eukprot:CAMPEP_0181312034 /NCGR_PEP_ID=MMETSP1101-20121128/13472_1 /TAXON_ID=46948 /ORGANISM="Rhodomonas abbreviata, Strain Caron Lab Isolate" /LENGTH=214 /DNA_ID=CAMNT_0023418839 /DNA_START=38 /DNA_END=682 /DNA_ORIENTATION=+
MTVLSNIFNTDTAASLRIPHLSMFPRIDERGRPGRNARRRHTSPAGCRRSLGLTSPRQKRRAVTCSTRDIHLTPRVSVKEHLWGSPAPSPDVDLSPRKSKPLPAHGSPGCISPKFGCGASPRSKASRIPATPVSGNRHGATSPTTRHVLWKKKTVDGVTLNLQRDSMMVRHLGSDLSHAAHRAQSVLEHQLRLSPRSRVLHACRTKGGGSVLLI